MFSWKEIVFGVVSAISVLSTGTCFIICAKKISGNKRITIATFQTWGYFMYTLYITTLAATFYIDMTIFDNGTYMQWDRDQIYCWPQFLIYLFFDMLLVIWYCWVLCFWGNIDTVHVIPKLNTLARYASSITSMAKFCKFGLVLGFLLHALMVALSFADGGRLMLLSSIIMASFLIPMVFISALVLVELFLIVARGNLRNKRVTYGIYRVMFVLFFAIGVGGFAILDVIIDIGSDPNRVIASYHADMETEKRIFKSLRITIPRLFYGISGFLVSIPILFNFKSGESSSNPSNAKSNTLNQNNNNTQGRMESIVRPPTVRQSSRL